MAILSIQSHVVYGHVGNQAAVFALQRLGHEVWPLHSLQYSAHAGYGRPKGTLSAAGTLIEIVEDLARHRRLGACSALLSGYLGNEDQVPAVARALECLKAANPAALYALDPVIGDRAPGLYVAESLARSIRDRLLPLADLAFPNHFELEYLVGRASPRPGEILSTARRLLDLGPREVYVTSLLAPARSGSTVGLGAVTPEGAWQVTTPRLEFPAGPNGAGDLISALILAHRLAGLAPGEALARATASVFGVLAATLAAGSRELCLVAAQQELVAPSHSFPACRIA